MRYLLVQVTYLLGILAAGWLAEGVAVSLLLILSGALGALIFLLWYAIRTVREVETLLPDWAEVS